MARKAQAASSFPGSHQLGYDHATDWRRRLSVVTCPAFPFQGSLAQSGPRGEPATAPTLDPGAPGDSPGLLFRGVAARAPAPHWRWPVKTPVRLLAAGGGSRRSPALFGCRRGPVELHPRLPPRRFIHPLHANPHLTLPTPRPLPLSFPFLQHTSTSTAGRRFTSGMSAVVARWMRPLASATAPRVGSSPVRQRVRDRFYSASASASAQGSLPLEGYRVLDMTRVLAGVSRVTHPPFSAPPHRCTCLC